MNHQIKKMLEQDEHNKMAEKIRLQRENSKRNFNAFTKNNLIAFLGHLVIISLFFIVTMIFEKGYISGFLYKIFAVIFIIPYVVLGYKLNINLNKRFDFWSGLIISILGIVVWIFVLLVGSEKILVDSQNLNIFWRATQSYINIFYVSFLWGWGKIKNIIYINLVLCFVPSFLIGIGLKFKRMMNEPFEG